MAAVVEALACERERWPLWLPVAMGLGIVVYFSLPTEPASSLGVGLACGAALAVAIGWHRPVLMIPAVVTLAATLGFSAAQLRTWSQTAPMLQRDTGVVVVSGRAILTESMPDGVRMTLSEVKIARLPREQTPAQVRIRLKKRYSPPPPGAMIRVRAFLRPPPEPAEPGAYDFQRQAFFDGNGAIGYALSSPKVVEDGPPSFGWRALTLPMERLRAAFARRCAEVLPDEATATVTAALLNGEQTGIPVAVMTDYRNSGLAHLLSISGLHIALVAGLVFFAVRAGLALIEPVALYCPIKKGAALCGLLTAFIYMLVVGAAAPTLRSVLMTGTVMVAIMADRNPLSMRLLALSAVVIMAWTPEAMMGPSFQMSYAAVAALIAVFEVVNPLVARWRREIGGLGQAGLYLGVTTLTSVVATLAVTPFSLFHFQQDALYGVLSNMVAVPLTSFWVMPWALVVYLLTPFGLEAWALVPMGWGVAACNWLAHVTAALPGAVIRVPAMPAWGMGVIVFGGLWLLLWLGRWRLWGLPLILAGFTSIALTPRPDILISADGSVIAVHSPSGELSLSTDKPGNRLIAETWVHRDGRDRPGEPWPVAGTAAGESLSCDGPVCRYRRNGRTAVLLRGQGAQAAPCFAADIIISAGAVAACPRARVIDGATVARDGAHAVYLEGAEPRVASTRSQRGERPWTRTATIGE